MADPATLTDPDLVDAIVASEKALSRPTGQQMRMRPPSPSRSLPETPCRRVELFVADAATCLASAEIAAALRISPVTADIRVREAATMTTDLAPRCTPSSCT